MSDIMVGGKAAPPLSVPTGRIWEPGKRRREDSGRFSKG